MCPPRSSNHTTQSYQWQRQTEAGTYKTGRPLNSKLQPIKSMFNSAALPTDSLTDGPLADWSTLPASWTTTAQPRVTAQPVASRLAPSSGWTGTVHLYGRRKLHSSLGSRLLQWHQKNKKNDNEDFFCAHYWYPVQPYWILNSRFLKFFDFWNWNFSSRSRFPPLFFFWRWSLQWTSEF